MVIGMVGRKEEDTNRKLWGFAGGSDSEISLQCRRPGSVPELGEIP